VLGLSAEFGLEYARVGVYDDQNQLLATMNGSFLSLPNTPPVDVHDATGNLLMQLWFESARLSYNLRNEWLVVSHPNGIRIGTIYLRSLHGNALFGLRDHATDTDIGWMTSANPSLYSLTVTDAQNAPLAWLQVVAKDLHMLSTSRESWRVSLMRQLTAVERELVLAAVIIPPSLLHNAMTRR
jgi:hypothetical protein